MSYLKDIAVQTPLGEFHMISQYQNDRDIVRASGFGTTKDLQKRLPLLLAQIELKQSEDVHPYKKQITSYFKGNMTALDSIPFEQEGSSFSKAVWQVMRAIIPGQTISYKELAARAQHPAAVRAVGTACGQNRLILLVPCHRIIKSDGSLGSYLYGTKVKEKLLAHETKYNTQKEMAI